MTIQETKVPTTRRRLNINFNNPNIAGGLAVGWLGLLVLVVAICYVVPAFDPNVNDYTAILQAPSAAHPMGTDNLGRDVFVRTMYGAGASLLIALIAVFVGGALGVLIGTTVGYFRGWADQVFSFFVDTLLAFPSLLLVVTVVALRGPSLTNIALIIALMSIPTFGRMARASAMTLSGEAFVMAARTMGASHWHIIFKELMPNVLPTVAPYAITAAANAIILEGAISFLGFGLRPPAPSWGGLIADGRDQLAQAPWVSLGPAILLCITILAINGLGSVNFGKKKNS